MQATAKIEQFQWTFQGTSFSAYFMVLPLNGCDLVLGVQQLQQLGAITWDFLKLEIKFKWTKQKVVFHGLKQGSVKEVKTLNMNKIREKCAQFSMIFVPENNKQEQMSLCSLDVSVTNKHSDSMVGKLILDYQDIFEEPTGLPHFRKNHNHKIPLLEVSNPINQRLCMLSLRRMRLIKQSRICQTMVLFNRILAHMLLSSCDFGKKERWQLEIVYRLQRIEWINC